MKRTAEVHRVLDCPCSRAAFLPRRPAFATIPIHSWWNRVPES